jgi:YD repeat-containing protein
VLERHDYDGNGNRIHTRDADTTAFEYDAANRLSRKVEAPGTLIEGATTYVVDDNGNVEEERDARTLALGGPYSVRRTFDRLNRVETETDAEANRTACDYDEEGNRILVQEPNGQGTRFAHDELGKPSGSVQPTPARRAGHRLRLTRRGTAPGEGANSTWWRWPTTGWTGSR